MNWLSKIFAWFKRSSEPQQSNKKEKHSEMTLQERRQERIREQNLLQKELDKSVEEVRKWRNRAWMARKQSNADLEQQALDRMWHHQVDVAKLKGIEPPPAPPTAGEFLYDSGSGGSPSAGGPDDPWRPENPSRVPKKPLPFSGGNEIALPLPQPDEDDT